MENRELSLKLQQLKNYQIGLHNIRVLSYEAAIESVDTLPLLETNICEKNIAESIIQTGLVVADKGRGLTSTVKMINKFDETSLNYTYISYPDGLVWNIIVAIPYFLKYKGKEFFIGSMDMVNLATISCFNPIVFKEFIYGYYCKKLKRLKYDDYEKLRWGIYYEFSDELDFIENPNFFENLDEINQKLVLERILSKEKRLLENLKLVNSKSLKIFFRPSIERYLIRQTREQRKRLFYGKK